MSNTYTKVIEILEGAAERAAQQAFSDIHSSICESEIEKILAAAFLSEQIAPTHWPRPFILTAHAVNEPLESVFGRSECLLNQYSIDCVVWPQIYIGPFRTDFLCIVAGDSNGQILPLAIECDGHDYHDRNKEQVRRDKARDRLFIAQGIPTMRFSSSEIWRDACSCVHEIQGYFRNIIDGKAAA